VVARSCLFVINDLVYSCAAKRLQQMIMLFSVQVIAQFGH
jgi:hypothetical protein